MSETPKFGILGGRNNFTSMLLEKNLIILHSCSMMECVALKHNMVCDYFEWSDEDASEASIRVAFPSEARKSGA